MSRRRKGWTRLVLGLAGLALGGVGSGCSVLTRLDDPTPGAPGDASIAPSTDSSVAPALDAAADSPTDGASDAPLPADACGASGACGGDGKTPYYGAVYVDQSFPFATSALSMVEGQIIPSYVELRNVGDVTWDSTTQLATTEPRDRASLFADNSWISTSRVAAVTGKIATGGTYKFLFDLQAPSTPGTYFEHFGLVSGAVWFGDPGQGGPPDGDIEVQIVVTAP